VHVHLRAGRLSLGRSGDRDWRGGCEGLRRGGGALDVLHPQFEARLGEEGLRVEGWGLVPV
jgi:hypothetical protein